MLLDNDTIDDILVTLKAEDCYRDSHRIVFAAIKTVYERGKGVDAITLAEELTTTGMLEAVGGLEFLAEVVNCVPSPANARYYADIVKQKAIARRAIDFANETLREAYSNTLTAEQLVDHLETRALDVADLGLDDTASDLMAPMSRTLDRIMNRKAGPSGLCVGYDRLDMITDGLQPGMLVILAARPSMGKTSFLLNIHEWVALGPTPQPALMISLEMGESELLERMLCTRSGVFNTKLKGGNLTDTRDISLLAKAYDELRTAPMFIDTNPSRTVTQFAAIARRYRKRQKIGLLSLDYLQLLDMEDDSGNSRQEQVAKCSRRLKVLARSLGIPIVILSQLNRANEHREDKRPRMADLRESGAIEQDADLVLLLHRPSYYKPDDKPGIMELIVAKNRNGETGTIDMAWDGPTYQIRSIAHQEIVPYIEPAEPMPGEAAYDANREAGPAF